MAAIGNRDSNGIYGGAANIAHRAGRVLQVAEMESQNSEDPNFVDRVNQASEVLNSGKWLENQSLQQHKKCLMLQMFWNNKVIDL